ncbi:hypothetical protein [Paenibacillus sp. An7]|uniref:hypothetical protein n=1 Tax=Paenibacillus sp. An7 TaxID=2689577 RepID=UPI00135B5C59|nr:hypothetical protein [Paenibacillus sp. An7]
MNFRFKAVQTLTLLIGISFILCGCMESRTTMETWNQNQEVLSLPSKNDPELTFGIIYPMVNGTYEMITENAESSASDYNIKLIVQAPDEAT